MKRLLAVPLLALALVGCSGSDEAVTATTTTITTPAARDTHSWSYLAETSEFATHFRDRFPALAAGHRDRPLNYSGSNECVGPTVSLTIKRFASNGLEPTKAEAKEIHAMAVRDICSRR